MVKCCFWMCRRRRPSALFDCWQELRFFPDFCQRYSLKKHLNATEARYGEAELGFAPFVETLCRICFCRLPVKIEHFVDLTHAISNRGFVHVYTVIVPLECWGIQGPPMFSDLGRLMVVLLFSFYCKGSGGAYSHLGCLTSYGHEWGSCFCKALGWYFPTSSCNLSLVAISIGFFRGETAKGCVRMW